MFFQWYAKYNEPRRSGIHIPSKRHCTTRHSKCTCNRMQCTKWNWTCTYFSMDSAKHSCIGSYLRLCLLCNSWSQFKIFKLKNLHECSCSILMYLGSLIRSQTVLDFGFEALRIFQSPGDLKWLLLVVVWPLLIFQLHICNRTALSNFALSTQCLPS